MLDLAPLIPIIALIFSSFLVGYGVRELVSQQRRISARRHYHK
jgi:hypothetical protein